MGIHKNLFGLIEKACQELNIKLEGCHMCGFDSNVPRIAKIYFESLCVEHTSIDMNGLNGSLPLDLSEHIEKFHECFDIVTNYGTTEHIKNQYNVFWNMHNFVRVGGALINVVPPAAGGWLNHECLYYYELQFFEELAKKNNYKLVFQELKCGTGSGSPLVCTIAIREKTDAFINQKEFESIQGIKLKI